MYIQFFFEYFPNGRPDKDTYKVVIEMQQQYGLELDEEEFEQFKLSYRERVQEAEQLMLNDPQFKKVGIFSYEAFREMDVFSGNKEWDKLNSYAMFNPGIDLFWELQGRAYLIEQYERRLERPYANLSNEDAATLQRMDEMVASGTLNTIFPSMIYGNFKSVMFYVYAISIISILLIVSPIFLRDRRSRVVHLQHASRIGRSLFRSKLIAAMLSAVLIITLQLGCFFLLYSQQPGIDLFYDAPINSGL